MASRRSKAVRRHRIGKVSIYLHHGAWWAYYREQGKPVRRKVAESEGDAQRIAAQINGQLATYAPTLLSFQPISVAELRKQFLDHHEHLLKSSVATVKRYRAATQHLQDFIAQAAPNTLAHQVKPERFAAYLRSIQVAPNGHPKAAKRSLRDKGIQFILEVCRGMYSYAGKQRYLPPYEGNPFAQLSLDRLKIDDAKPVFVFNSSTEQAFLKACDEWSFPIHFTLAKSGLRVGELTHLLIEDVDLMEGWLWIKNKPDLGWRIKTGSERKVPLIFEVVQVLKRVIGLRKAGPVFQRLRFQKIAAPLVGDRRALAKVFEQRCHSSEKSLTRQEASRMAWTVWRDAGAIKADAIRKSFIRMASLIGHPEATCPKSWRHTFATLLQDANVDPLIRQLTMGHKPTQGGALGMTATYTHTRPETQKEQIERALKLWPESLLLAKGGAK